LLDIELDTISLIAYSQLYTDRVLPVKKCVI
jgi:hypothetical protein